jgi:hypothetical protein
LNPGKNNLILFVGKRNQRGAQPMEKKFGSLKETRGLLLNQQTYALQKIEGRVSLDRRKVVLEEGLKIGDSVVIIQLPDNSFILSKDSDNESGLVLHRITNAYVQFDGDIVVNEV